MGNAKRGFIDAKPLEELEIEDDFIFMLVMQRKQVCKDMVKILLGIDTKDIVYAQTQKAKRPFYLSKSVRFDAYMKGSDKVVNIEMQASHYANIGLRARYYQSMIDATLLKMGADYSTLRQTYLIFICKDDPYTIGYPVYTMKSCCLESPELDVADGIEKKFFNCSAWAKVKDEELKAFMEYVHTHKATSDFTQRLEDIIQEEKSKEENLMKYHDFNMVAMDAKREGMQKGIYTTARAMLKDNMDLSLVSKYTNLPIEKLKELSMTHAK